MATADDRHSEVADGDITVIQLPPSERKKTSFLRQLQNALGPTGSIGALSPGHAEDVFIVPQPLEAELRATLGLSLDSNWERALRAWGALAVNRLSRDALFHLFQRGVAVVDGEVLGTHKLTASAGALGAKPAPDAGVLPATFRGPYDWNLDARGCNVVAAWQMFAQAPQFRQALPWADIQVAHVDTGYTEHAALGWVAGTSTTVFPSKGYDYWDGAFHPDPRDDWLVGAPGHGTRISGAIAGFGAVSTAAPFYGVTPGVPVVPYRVTDSVIVDHKKREIAQAIRRAVDSGCHVVNISLGALSGSRHLSDSLDYAYERGVIVVCAAGQIWGEVIYPGRYNRCITMGGIGPGLKPWHSAARGIYVDLCGPADRIRRIRAEKLPPGTAASGVYPKPDGDGTSYATATCTGVAVLWLAWHGVDNLRAYAGANDLWRIPATFKKLARATATPGNWSAADASNYGSGVINAAALLAAPLPVVSTVVKAMAAAAPFDPND